MRIVQRILRKVPFLGKPRIEDVLSNDDFARYTQEDIRYLEELLVECSENGCRELIHTYFAVLSDLATRPSDKGIFSKIVDLFRRMVSRDDVGESENTVLSKKRRKESVDQPQKRIKKSEEDPQDVGSDAEETQRVDDVGMTETTGRRRTAVDGRWVSYGYCPKDLVNRPLHPDDLDRALNPNYNFLPGAPRLLFGKMPTDEEEDYFEAEEQTVDEQNSVERCNFNDGKPYTCRQCIAKEHLDRMEALGLLKSEDVHLNVPVVGHASADIDLSLRVAKKKVRSTYYVDWDVKVPQAIAITNSASHRDPAIWPSATHSEDVPSIDVGSQHENIAQDAQNDVCKPAGVAAMRSDTQNVFSAGLDAQIGSSRENESAVVAQEMAVDRTKPVFPAFVFNTKTTNSLPAGTAMAAPPPLNFLSGIYNKASPGVAQPSSGIFSALPKSFAHNIFSTTMSSTAANEKETAEPHALVSSSEAEMPVWNMTAGSPAASLGNPLSKKRDVRSMLSPGNSAEHGISQPMDGARSIDTLFAPRTGAGDAKRPSFLDAALNSNIFSSVPPTINALGGTSDIFKTAQPSAFTLQDQGSEGDAPKANASMFSVNILDGMSSPLRSSTSSLFSFNSNNDDAKSSKKEQDVGSRFNRRKR